MQSQVLAHAVSKIMAEKRDNERVKSAFSAIVSQSGEFCCHCIIRDVSQNGMRLEFAEASKLTGAFEIRTPAMPELLDVKCAWKSNKLMGVEFVVSDDKQAEDVEQISGAV